ncbi:MAG: 3-oxoacyl-[acyl-carrier-protein] reductase [bacterium]
MSKFSKQVIVVTGSTRGIGYEIAKKFANENAEVIISGTTEEKCNEAKNKLEKESGKAISAIPLNLADKQNCKAFIETIIEKHKKIDVLINNAGITKDNLLVRMTEEQWTDVINCNLNGCFLLCKYTLKHMLKKRYGRIINISSIIGIMGNAGQSNYAAAKAGIIGFTKSIAKEFATKGITCNTIAPGFIETDMTKTLPAKQIEAIINSVPVKRMGKSEDVANLALFLASKEEASYITGQAIQIDGGLNM